MQKQENCITYSGLNDLFLGIDNLIAQRLTNLSKLETFEEFSKTREKIVEQVAMAMKIKDEKI